ncbi:hypothetical protein PsYK624_115790 [Phanerochaete sordida]|uniref:Uncharacterized protein n=1 Tax=Phanerochaete sordida TaxID=48140 RepID=A0A9P3LHJ5_9APHY|nr:hypothetical protein PsYK624_115790 [Phanerochaete sordida]
MHLLRTVPGITIEWRPCADADRARRAAFAIRRTLTPRPAAPGQVPQRPQYALAGTFVSNYSALKRVTYGLLGIDDVSKLSSNPLVIGRVTCYPVRTRLADPRFRSAATASWRRGRQGAMRPTRASRLGSGRCSFHASPCAWRVFNHLSSRISWTLQKSKRMPMFPARTERSHCKPTHRIYGRRCYRQCTPPMCARSRMRKRILILYSCLLVCSRPS